MRSSLLARCLSFIGTLFLLGTTCLTVHAQTPTPQPAVVGATVNIQNAAITSQQGHVLSLSFNFTNRQIMQPNVHYGVQLVATTSGGSVADSYVFPDTVMLGENTTVHKDITYTAPASLGGSYDVYLISKNDQGFPLGIARAGTVTLAPSAGVQIVGNTCALSIVGLHPSTTYTLGQGVDISAKEQLQLSCQMTNSSADTVTLTPSYETHYRTVYGPAVSATGGDMSPFVLNAGETKTITLILPTATSSQAYDVTISVHSATLTSNTVVAHYVLRGESSTIQNVALDKTSYQQGDTALISFVWTPAADGFYGSRMGTSSPAATQAQISLTNGAGGAPCAPLKTISLNASRIVVPITITANCPNPYVSVVLLGAQGNVLSQENIDIQNPSWWATHLRTMELFGIIGTLMILGGVFVFLRRQPITASTVSNT